MVTVVPEAVTLYLALPVMLSGASILLLVCVVVDLMAEIEARRAHAGSRLTSPARCGASR